MYWLELQDVLFLVKCLQGTTDNFNIHDFIPAPSSSHCPTRASQSGKFKHKLCRTVAGHHFYLNRIIRLWNALPQIDLSLPFQSIKHLYLSFSGIISLLIFNPTSHVHIILCVLVPHAHLFPIIVVGCFTRWSLSFGSICRKVSIIIIKINTVIIASESAIATIQTTKTFFF